MVLEDHINLMGMNPLIGPNEDELGPRFFDMTRRLRPRAARDRGEGLLEGGRDRAQGRLHRTRRGPSYETPAEIRMARDAGRRRGGHVHRAGGDRGAPHGRPLRWASPASRTWRRACSRRRSTTGRCWRSGEQVKAGPAGRAGPDRRRARRKRREACAQDAPAGARPTLARAGARRARRRAFAPFSGFKVGAALRWRRRARSSPAATSRTPPTASPCAPSGWRSSRPCPRACASSTRDGGGGGLARVSPRPAAPAGRSCGSSAATSGCAWSTSRAARARSACPSCCPLPFDRQEPVRRMRALGLRLRAAARDVAAPLRRAAARTVDLVVRNGTVVTMDPDRRVIAGGAVAVDAARIVAVGPAAEIAKAIGAADVARRAAAASSCPASINAHTTRRWCCSAASPTT